MRYKNKHKFFSPCVPPIDWLATFSLFTFDIFRSRKQVVSKGYDERERRKLAGLDVNRRLPTRQLFEDGLPYLSTPTLGRLLLLVTDATRHDFLHISSIFFFLFASCYRVGCSSIDWFHLSYSTLPLFFCTEFHLRFFSIACIYLPAAQSSR